MNFPGMKRVRKVYLVWLFIYLILIYGIFHFQLKYPTILLIIIIVLSAKTIFLDFKIIKINRKRVYWAEHGPLLFLLIIIGFLDIANFDFFKGYVNPPALLISLLGFILDIYKDLKENPRVYDKIIIMDDQNLESNQVLPPTEPSSTPSVDTPKSKSGIFLIILPVLLIIGGYWLWQGKNITPPSALPEGEGTYTSPLGGGSEGVEGWKTYRNDKYGFEFKYPPEYRNEAPQELERDGVSRLRNYPEGEDFYGVDNQGNQALESRTGYNIIQLAILYNDENKWIGEQDNASLKKKGFSKVMIGENEVIKSPDRDLLPSGSIESVEYTIPLNKEKTRLLTFYIYGDSANFNILNKILSTFRFIK
ncbi:MAG: hypothetical protein AAB415_01390 [Patescibacteria group bacterium]